MNPRRIVIAGMPRSGTTLLATILAAQPTITFHTDYLGSFEQARVRLGVALHTRLDVAQKRFVLALVRDELLRWRHPVLVKAEEFTSIDELHRLVCGELRDGDTPIIGHKSLLTSSAIVLWSQLDLVVIVMIRDPRDAGLSYLQRVGGGVEAYLRDWRDTVRMCRNHHPRNLVSIRYEDLVASPDEALASLAAVLGTSIDPSAGSLVFRRGARCGAKWTENSSFGDVQRRFDTVGVRRWKARRDSLAVLYAGWSCESEIRALGYPTWPTRDALPLAKRLRLRARHAAFQVESALRDGAERGVGAIRRIVPPISS